MRAEREQSFNNIELNLNDALNNAEQSKRP